MNNIAETTNSEIVSAFLAALNRESPAEATAVLLIGSVARSAATMESDLDLLVLTEQEVVVDRTSGRLHVQFMLELDFLERLRKGDDFAAWCARFGIPVQPGPIWTRILQSPEAKNWPDWRQKIDHASRRLLLANELMALGDEAAATEELLYAVSHVARALLLKEDRFPLSRPEMVRQLADAGHRDLSTVLEDLVARRCPTPRIRQGIQYTKKLLVYLDRDRYEAYVRARREVRSQKTNGKKRTNGVKGPGGQTV